MTVLLLLVAIYLLSRPRSVIRSAWAEYRADVKSATAARRLWPDLIKTSSPLSDIDSDAVVIEISDYECPFCRRVNPVVDTVLSAGLRIAYLNYPLPSHPRAEGAAIAVLCAESGGRFRQLHDRFMTSSEWRTDSNWLREARLAGVPDLQSFKNCLTSDQVRQRLRHQIELAESLGVTGTPTFVSRKSLHRGVLTVRELIALGSND